MPELLDRLKTALADRYSIERELGAGGMATVYLAEDLKHRRIGRTRTQPSEQTVAPLTRSLTGSRCSRSPTVHGLILPESRTPGIQ